MRVEQEGIRRTFETAREADLILWLVDPTSPDVHLPADLLALSDRVLIVRNKSDLIRTGAPPVLPDDSVLVSAVSGQGLDDLTARVAAIAEIVSPTAVTLPPSRMLGTERIVRKHTTISACSWMEIRTKRSCALRICDARRMPGPADWPHRRGRGSR